MSKRWEAGLTEEMLDACERAIDYRFRDRSLLRISLTHASGANHRLESNERLEFLGDAILGMLVCEMLFAQFPQQAEGELTRIKSMVVSRTTCARISQDLRLIDSLHVGKGLSIASDDLPASVAAAAFESLVAAIYLDGGFEAVRVFVQRSVGPALDEAASHEHGLNFKSQLQQLAQKNHGSTPVYLLIDERGPDHSKWFKVAAMVGSLSYQAAWGPNKKLAEQRAAENALSELDGKPAPHTAEEATVEPAVDPTVEPTAEQA
jgi:ribonuclease-3